MSGSEKLETSRNATIFQDRNYKISFVYDASVWTKSSSSNTLLFLIKAEETESFSIVIPGTIDLTDMLTSTDEVFNAQTFKLITNQAVAVNTLQL